MSLWSFNFSIIKELPYSKRTLKDIILIAGLWFGDTKPCMGNFQRPFDKILNSLREGFQANLPDGRDITAKAILLGGTCHMPAKSQVLNMVQFNGFYGCPRCLQPEDTMESGNGHTYAYQYDSDNPSEPQRSIEGFQNEKETYEEGCRVEGVDGPSWFLYLANVVRGTAIDYMHQIL